MSEDQGTRQSVPPGTVQTTPQPILIEVKKHGLIVRALYFVLIGWWFGLFWSFLSWFMYATVVFAPIGVVMMNKIPGAVSLKAREKNVKVISDEKGYTVRQVNQKQFPILVRIIYYPIGLVASLLTILLGWLLCCLLITLPLGIMVFNVVPAVASLHRG